MTEAPAAAIRQTFWGYVIAPEGPSRPGPMQVFQIACIVVAAALAGGALVVLFVGGPALSGTMRPFLAWLAVALAVPLVWFGTRGDRVEIEIDLSLGEVREVVRNRAGGPSLVGRYGFDTLDGLDVALRRGGSGRLNLWRRGEKRPIELLRGPAPVLERIAQQLRHDMESGSGPVAHFDTLAPLRRPGVRIVA